MDAVLLFTQLDTTLAWSSHQKRTQGIASHAIAHIHFLGPAAVAWSACSCRVLGQNFS
jgi:hypothetical protein